MVVDVVEGVEAQTRTVLRQAGAGCGCGCGCNEREGDAPESERGRKFLFGCFLRIFGGCLLFFFVGESLVEVGWLLVDVGWLVG